MLQVLFVFDELLVLFLDDIIQPLQSFLMLLHLGLHLLLELLALGKHIIIYDLLYILPLGVELLLDLDDLLVLMPCCLTVILLEEGVANATYFDTCQDINHFTLINFVLVTAYLVDLGPQGEVHFDLLGKLALHSLQRLMDRVMLLVQCFYLCFRLVKFGAKTSIFDQKHIGFILLLLHIIFSNDCFA